MISFHPDTQYLVEYAAGSLSIGLAVCVATHVEQCWQCQQQLQGLNTYGGELIEQLEPVDINDDLLEKTLQVLDTNNTTTKEQTIPFTADIPKAISQLIPQGFDALPWKRYGKNLQICRLSVGEDKYEVSLIRMQAGGAIHHHRHKGLEMTVILKGALSDKFGIYQAGDLSACDQHDEHNPMATQDRECICLTAVEAAVQFTGWKRVFNPFLGFQPT